MNANARDNSRKRRRLTSGFDQQIVHPLNFTNQPVPSCFEIPHGSNPFDINYLQMLHLKKQKMTQSEYECQLKKLVNRGLILRQMCYSNSRFHCANSPAIHNQSNVASFTESAAKPDHANLSNTPYNHANVPYFYGNCINTPASVNNYTNEPYTVENHMNVPHAVNNHANVPNFANDSYFVHNRTNVYHAVNDGANVPYSLNNHANVSNNFNNHANVPYSVNNQTNVPHAVASYANVSKFVNHDGNVMNHVKNYKNVTNIANKITNERACVSVNSAPNNRAIIDILSSSKLNFVDNNDANISTANVQCLLRQNQFTNSVLYLSQSMPVTTNNPVASTSIENFPEINTTKYDLKDLDASDFIPIQEENNVTTEKGEEHSKPTNVLDMVNCNHTKLIADVINYKKSSPLSVACKKCCQVIVNASETAVCCAASCLDWYHRRCVGLSDMAYYYLKKEKSVVWICGSCSK